MNPKMYAATRTRATRSHVVSQERAPADDLAHARPRVQLRRKEAARERVLHRPAARELPRLGGDLRPARIHLSRGAVGHLWEAVGRVLHERSRGGKERCVRQGPISRPNGVRMPTTHAATPIERQGARRGLLSAPSCPWPNCLPPAPAAPSAHTTPRGRHTQRGPSGCYATGPPRERSRGGARWGARAFPPLKGRLFT